MNDIQTFQEGYSKEPPHPICISLVRRKYHKDPSRKLLLCLTGLRGDTTAINTVYSVGIYLENVILGMTINYIKH